MAMIDCKYFRVDCSECDTSDGIPECYECRYKTCPTCLQDYDEEVGCISCEIRAYETEHEPLANRIIDTKYGPLIKSVPL